MKGAGLILTLKEGEGFRVAGRRAKIEKILAPTKFRLLVDSGESIDVDDQASQEVLQDVWVACGERGQATEARVCIAAHPLRKISREQPSELADPETKVEDPQQERLGYWYAQAILWMHIDSGNGRLGRDLEVIGADEKEDAIVEAHKMIDRYHRFVGPRCGVEVGIGFGDHELPHHNPATPEPRYRAPWDRDYQVTAAAMAEGERLGLSGAVEEQIREMCRRSAPVTQPDPRYDRRFYEYTFWIDGDRVMGVANVKPY